jgi:citrate lyase subunit beta/citryl-CoA lyase
MTPFAFAGPALLFCPADRPDRYTKAAAGADVVIIDLEDAVAPESKPSGRQALLEAAPALDPVRTIVRINAPGSPWWADDLGLLASMELSMVMVPKVTSAAQLEAVERFHAIPICETAAGVLAAGEIASAPNCVAILWGGEDLIADLGGRSSRRPDGSYHHVVQQARSTVLLAASASGRLAIDGIYVDIEDLEGLAGEAAEASALGFRAKACIHPRQVNPVRAAFAPRPEEILWARGVREAAANTTAGVFSYEGRMVDAPLLRHAEAILAAARPPARTDAPPDR